MTERRLDKDHLPRHVDLDVLEGRQEEDGRLVLSNRETGTAIRIYNQIRHAREVLHEIRADSFRLDREVSVDGGESCQSCEADCGACPPCWGIVCDTPPEDYCMGDTLRKYDTPGTCTDGIARGVR